MEGRQVEEARSWLEVAGAVLAAVIWFVRLEARARHSAGEIAELKREQKEIKFEQRALELKIYDKLAGIERSLAKIEGRLLRESEQP